MKQLTVISENRVGVLADICNILGHAGVNLESISAMGMGDHGVIRVITSDPITAEKLLKRKGYNVNVEDVIVVKVRNRPGELGKITELIAREGVNLESVYLLNKDDQHAYISIKPASEKEYETLKDVLSEHMAVE